MTDLYVYRARLIVPPHGGDPVFDGDTWWLHVDYGFDGGFRDKFRSKRWDMPEVTGSAASEFEKEKGAEARVEAIDWFDEEPFYVRTFKASEAHDVEDRGKYGRWLAEPFRVFDGEEQHLGEHLASLDLATEWPMRWREQFDTERDG